MVFAYLFSLIINSYKYHTKLFISWNKCHFIFYPFCRLFFSMWEASLDPYLVVKPPFLHSSSSMCAV